MRKIIDALVAGDKVPHAIEVLQRLAKLRPRDKEARLELAKYYSWTDRPQDRFEVLLELLALEPESLERRREIMAEARNLERRDVVLQQAIWLQRRGQLDHEGQLSLAEAYIEQKQPQKAMAICKGILDQNASGAVLARAGEMAMGQEYHRLAHALLTEALRKDPAQERVLKQLALAEMALGRAEKAIMLMQAYTRRHADFEAHYILGEYLNGMGRKKEALRQFKLAQALMVKSQRTAKP